MSFTLGLMTMKRLFVFLLVQFLLFSLSLSSCVQENVSGKIQIVTTLFPQYDFARQIAGDKADVTMLITPGVESHSFDPSPADIIKVNLSQLFIYTGEYMEAWAKRIIDGLDNKDVVVLNVTDGITLELTEDEETGEDGHDESDHLYDPHVWTDPNNAMIMAENITNALCSIDPYNAEYYKANASAYILELKDLDTAFQEVVEGGNRRQVIFGGRNPFYYFLTRYGLSYMSAYDSCSTETEPSVKIVAKLMDEIKEKELPVIFYEELREPKVAKSISDETGIKMLLFHSCHNVSKAEMNDGATYLSLMKQNLRNLEEALN